MSTRLRRMWAFSRFAWRERWSAEEEAISARKRSEGEERRTAVVRLRSVRRFEKVDGSGCAVLESHTLSELALEAVDLHNEQESAQSYEKERWRKRTWVMKSS
jgi:hypothetical protein